MKDRRRVLGIGALALAVVALVVVLAWPGADPPPELGLNAFSQKLASGSVAKVTLLDRDHALRGTLTNGREFRVQFPEQSTDEITRQLTRAKVAKFTVDQQNENRLVSTLLALAPFAFILVLVVVLLRHAQGGRGLLEFWKKTRPVQRPTVTFADVAGLPEAVEELSEIRDFLRDPA